MCIGGVFEHLGDAEVEQVRAVVRIDKHVRRLDIAMHDQQAMWMRDRVAELQDHPAARFEIDIGTRAPLVERHAVNVAHDQVRATVSADAAVEQRRDRRMGETDQDLPLAAEAREDLIRIHAEPDELQRTALGAAVKRAFGKVYGAHAPAAEHAQDLKVPDLLVRRQERLGIRQRARAQLRQQPPPRRRFGIQKSARARMVFKQRLDFFPQPLVPAARARQKLRPLARCQFRRAQKNLLEPLRWCSRRRVHSSVSEVSAPATWRFSHARAKVQSFLTVAGETPSASAVSSIDSPAK